MAYLCTALVSRRNLMVSVQVDGNGWDEVHQKLDRILPVAVARLVAAVPAK